MATICSLIRQAAEAHSEHPAVRQRRAGGWCEVSYGALFEAVAEVGTALVELGLGYGEKVGILLNAGASWIIADLAVLCVGGIDVPRGSDFSLEDLSFIANHANLAAVITDLPPEPIERLREAAPTLRFVVRLGDPGGAGAAVIPWGQLRESGRALLAAGDRRFYQRLDQIVTGDIATIIYTSGTTGHPKGVMLSHANLISNVTAIRENLPIHPRERFLCVLPPYHMFERTVEYLALACGGCLTFTDKNNFRGDLAEVRPNIVAGVPRLWELLYQGVADRLRRHRWSAFLEMLLEGSRRFHRAGRGGAGAARLLGLASYPMHLLAEQLIYKAVRQGLGNELRFAVSGGGMLPAHLDEFFAVAGVTLLNGYGLSETSPVLTVRVPHDNPMGTVGKPLPGTELKIVGENGIEVPAGQPGVVWARGGQVMLGYYKDPEATEQVLRDGWLNTGDLGVLTEAGDLVIVGRAKDTIVLRGGENVEPEPIENALLLSPYLMQVMVVGQDRKYLAALVVPDLPAIEGYARKNGIDLPAGDAAAQHPAVVALVKSELARLHNGKPTTRNYEKIIRFRIIVEQWTLASGLMTFTLKKKRPAIAAACREVIEEMYREG
ncbi:AMP-dependent synthetase/ligase [Geomesophilobacter sediminis]|uniref:Long-chain fatty acid--CoA ligase n=1 Tax=Geomesophilobacter sediminis TaxID=2798584 RepID=A0A8J7LXS3_9BACT|nr:long-chain fatty acid--CoA ligase [Geomesophilobacter sediminis]MBJ6723652.1 long-chain fatty acid--CoA ligase [Geomesophilobacter sediminis]